MLSPNQFLWLCFIHTLYEDHPQIFPKQSVVFWPRLCGVSATRRALQWAMRAMFDFFYMICIYVVEIYLTTINRDHHIQLLLVLLHIQLCKSF